MENTVYLMLLIFAYALTILSFCIPRNITLRAFSALALLIAAIIPFKDPFFYVGFGSLNVITYGTSQVGDPSREAEIFANYMYGIMGGVQIWYVFLGILRFAGEQITKRGRPNIDKVI